ncbi:hypothetical protein ACN47E_009458 [Coniothyrium glycines]
MFAPRAFVTPIVRAASRPHTIYMTSVVASNYRMASSVSTISEVITRDHRELEKYYKEVINNPDDIDHQERWGNQFRWELARHSVAEELLVYPAMEKYLGELGHKHAEHDRKQHHRIKELLKEFQKMRATDSVYVPKLNEIWAALAEHIQEEERDDLPALEKAVRASDDPGDSVRLAGRFERTKKFVPTRAHPSAGESPWFEGPMGLLAAPIDRIADIFRKFPDDDLPPNPRNLPPNSRDDSPTRRDR